MDISMDGKVAVVVGGTRGIGLRLAQGMRDAGATVVPTSREPDRVAAAVEELGRGAADGIPVLPCDTTDEAALVGLRDAVLDRYGRVDVLVHAAGRHRRAPALETTSTDWRELLETNLTGTFLACRTFGEAMVRAGGGSIVAISSMGASVGLRDAAAYSASKAGVEQLVKVLAIEWAPYGVRVNALAPGFFLTELNADIMAEGTARRAAVEARTPMARTGDPAELVGAVVYLCSDSASFTTGEVLHVDGGFLAQGI